MTKNEPIAAGADARLAAKAYLRLETAEEDALLDRLIAAAIGHGEQFTGRLWLARAAEETLAALPSWQRLGATPVGSIAAVAALSQGGDATALDPADYAIDIDAGGDGWVRLSAPARAGRLRVSYTAGLAASWDELPEALRQGAVRLAVHLYTHRDAADEGAPPAAIAALWRPWRRMRLQ